MIENTVPKTAVGVKLMAAQNAILFRPEPLDGPAAGVVEEIGAKLDSDAAKRFKGMREQHQLAFRVERRALHEVRRLISLAASVRLWHQADLRHRDRDAPKLFATGRVVRHFKLLVLGTEHKCSAQAMWLVLVVSEINSNYMLPRPDLAVRLAKPAIVTIKHNVTASLLAIELDGYRVPLKVEGADVLWSRALPQRWRSDKDQIIAGKCRARRRRGRDKHDERSDQA